MNYLNIQSVDDMHVDKNSKLKKIGENLTIHD